ncbi:MAG: hypothetical protein KME17_17765 [Cyanosarcina radialis HA8281-LM2]|jgi:hypothetical protein|nr:hypothetical protein [Cyanosarcina radialis HA8281-LM2]
MKETFNPIKGKRGEFRVALNITELGDRAWDLLSLSQQLGFEKPQFATHIWHSGAVEVWAVILQQFHQYDADSSLVVDVWDDRLDQLRQAIGPDNEFSLMVLCNLAEYLEPVEAIA